MRSVQKQLHDKNVRPDAPACARVTRTDARLVCAGTRAVEPGGPGRSRPTAAARNREPRVGVRRSAASSPRHIRRLHTLSGSRAGHAAVPDASGRTESLACFATGQQGKAVPRRVAEPCKRATAWRYPLKPSPSVTPECVRSDRAWRCAELSWRAGRGGLGLASAVGHNGLDWTGPRTVYRAFSWPQAVSRSIRHVAAPRRICECAVSLVVDLTNEVEEHESDRPTRLRRRECAAAVCRQCRSQWATGCADRSWIR